MTPAPGLLLRQINIPLIVIMIGAIGFTITFKSLGLAIRDWKAFSFGLGMNFIFAPFICWLLAVLFLNQHHDLATGLVLIGVVPCAGMALVWVGLLTGIVGLGGGYALVPSFIYITKSPLRIAVGSSLASFVWFALVGGVIKYVQGFTDIIAALVMGIGAAGGAIIGARLMSKFKPATLKAVFGLIFLYVSLKYILLFWDIQI